MEFDFAKNLNCLHLEVRTFSPFLKCKECGMKLCGNCKQEWFDGHRCNTAYPLNLKDGVNMKDKFG